MFLLWSGFTSLLVTFGVADWCDRRWRGLIILFVWLLLTGLRVTYNPAIPD